jgi:hypothetical protein
MSVITNVRIKSVKSINRCKSVIQANYDIVKTHGGELKVETKEREEQVLLFNYSLSESRINWIARLHG